MARNNRKAEISQEAAEAYRQVKGSVIMFTGWVLLIIILFVRIVPIKMVMLLQPYKILKNGNMNGLLMLKQQVMIGIFFIIILVSLRILVFKPVFAWIKNGYLHKGAIFY